MASSRREFLARASAVAVAIAVSHGCARNEAPAESGSPAGAPAAGAGGADRATVLDELVRAGLLLMVQRLFPHPDVPALSYQVVVDALNGAAANAPPVGEMLKSGLEELDRSAGGSFASQSVERQTELLRSMESSPFFQTVRGTAVFTFYNQPAIWEAFGYEGEAWTKGGYLGRGLNDIDWLPEPGAAGRGPSRP